MIKRQILLTWLGRNDLDAAQKGQRGPIASILLDSEWPFDEVRILANDWFDQIAQYEAWLKKQLATRNRAAAITFREVELTSPIDYSSIYMSARAELERAVDEDARITVNLTSGTPAMIANWLLLGKGVYNTKLVQTSLQSGLSVVELPFDISLEYLQRQDSHLQKLAYSTPGDSEHFDHIQAKSWQMAEAIELARRVAPRNIPVVIQGESGTGKEVIAQAIHSASLRHDKPFIAVNCAAIPESLIDSQLFGHKKGAFTGAESDRKGFFDEAHGGTLFLDEVAELHLDAQSKLLRALQQREVTPVGASKPHQVDVRVIAATHRDLLAMVEKGEFREDLFYRLAVGIMQLPPLRARQDDIGHIAQELVRRLNEEAEGQPNYQSKKISKDAMKFIRTQAWPGNIRELWNTLLRASIWSEGDMISLADMQKAVIQRAQNSERSHAIDVSQGIDINGYIDEIRAFVVSEALRITAGQKGKAAKLLGLKNHQTLTNWMKQFGISDDGKAE